MPSFEISFEVFCARCGAGLCNQSDTRVSRTRSEPQVTVEPCEQCLSKASDESYEQGHTDGYAAGIEVDNTNLISQETADKLLSEINAMIASIKEEKRLANIEANNNW